MQRDKILRKLYEWGMSTGAGLGTYYLGSEIFTKITRHSPESPIEIFIVFAPALTVGGRVGYALGNCLYNKIHVKNTHETI
ncbi:MAG: hypothetical protein HYS80_01910 [Candidatus Aenigmarchaeota archaeon]|nr:hypothetical protein [Candidatus Aenigmarchaeota archaeon]